MPDPGPAASPVSRPCPRCGALYLGEICPSCPGAGETEADFPANPAPPEAAGAARGTRRRRTGRPLTGLRFLPRPSEAARRQPSERLHHFRIERRPDGTLHELGRGGMGVTYKALDERLRLPVALKVIAPFREHSTAAQSLFLREARAAARVRHSNVASVLYLNDTPGNFFYAMEFVDGVSLEEWLKAQPPLDAATALPLAEQIARGLAAIHAQGIIHRDLKPSNIMLVGRLDALGPRTLKIIDFGLARPIVRTESGTQSIGFRGTALYASPEQCEEAASLDGRSDLYSLGCIVFQMLTGTPPFTATSHRELMNQHVGGQIPLERLGHLPTELRSIVARLLAKSPEQRFASAELVIEELERCRQGLTRSAQDPPRQTPLVDTHKSWVPPGGHATTSAAAEPLSLRMQMPPPQPVGAPPAPPPVGAGELSEVTLPAVPKRVPAPEPIPMPGSDLEPTPEAPRGTMLRRLGLAAAAVFALGLAVGVLQRMNPSAPSDPPAAVVTPAAAAAPTQPEARPVPGPVATLRRALAVLPFANLSASQEAAHFAEGMHEDVITNLAKVRELRVISRSSVQGFAPGVPRELRAIGEKLGVSHVVEGSVRREQAKIRVTAQLVDVATGDTVWAESYDREASDVMVVQAQIALAIAGALKTTLSAGEKTALSEPPIASAKAYELFSKARALMKGATGNRHDFATAEGLLEEAVRLDPSFARAHAQLSQLHTMRYAFGTDRTDDRLAKAYATARRALQVGGEFADAYVALGGYFFRGLGDYTRGLENYRKAIALEPFNAEALANVANIQRRVGKWDEAIASYTEALRLNPLDINLLYNHANTLRYTRRYAECAAALAAAEAKVGYHILFSSTIRSALLLAWKGDISGFREAAAKQQPNDATLEIRLWFRVEWLLMEGRFDEARRTIEESSFSLLDGQQVYLTRSGLLAEIEESGGNRARAREVWQVALDEIAPLASARRDARLQLAHAFALAGVGRAQEACAEADRAMEDKRVVDDQFDAPAFRLRRALVYLRCGRKAEARAQIDELLKVPGDISEEVLRVHSIWKDLPPAPR
ncbi:MAG: protein kinase [Verrucomicrobia bacterium]|nr:protein kinase [Verrucomicrobiota bacterium]